MTCRKVFLSILGTILVIWFAGGCSTPKATPIPPTATLTPEPPTSTPTYVPPTVALTPESPTSTPTFVPPTVAPGGFPRRFHVEGNTFVDQYGQTMVFRGMAPIDPVLQALGGKPEYGVWGEHHYQVMAEWGANIIRVPIVPDNLHTHVMNEVLRILDQTIAWAAENKMYVIIDFHSIGWPPEYYYYANCDYTYPLEIMDFWDTISRRYADNDVVAFYELYNEPATRASETGYSATAEDWLVWKDFMEQVIAVVRANDPDKIILVGGLTYAYDLSFVADKPIEGSNIAYVTHPYSVHPMDDWDSAFGRLSSQYPVFATEFGYSQSDFPDIDINGTPYHQAIIDYLEAHHVSWTVWCFDATWQTTCGC